MELDIWKLWQLKVAVLLGLISLSLTLWNSYQQLRQRRREHRWKQADAAKKIWDDLLADRYAIDGSLMLDGTTRTFDYLKNKGHSDFTVTEANISSALADNFQNNFDIKAHYIIDCIDSLLFYWARAERYIISGLVLEEDLFIPGEYYAKQIFKSSFKNDIERFANDTGKADAIRFLNRMYRHQVMPATLQSEPNKGLQGTSALTRRRP